MGIRIAITSSFSIIKNGKKVYIGFAAIAGNLYKYIVPTSETVAFERSYGSISENGSVSAISSFSDVNADAYYAKYVAWVNEKGLIKGVGENTFAPNAKITREQMAVIILNFATLLKKADTLDGSLGYTDNISVSSWAMDGAKYCQGTKVITGREGGSFMPQGNATRAEVAAVIERFVKAIVE